MPLLVWETWLVVTHRLYHWRKTSVGQYDKPCAIIWIHKNLYVVFGVLGTVQWGVSLPVLAFVSSFFTSTYVTPVCIPWWRLVAFHGLHKHGAEYTRVEICNTPRRAHISETPHAEYTCEFWVTGSISCPTPIPCISLLQTEWELALPGISWAGQTYKGSHSFSLISFEQGEERQQVSD